MRVIKWLDNYLEEAILVVMLLFMMVIMGIQVTARYVFSYSLSWSEEITRYLFGQDFLVPVIVSKEVCQLKSNSL